MSDSAALKVAVVGHVNTGKTSLISTLARRDDLATGTFRTTTAVEEIRFESEGRTLLTLIDTPGFELVGDILLELERDRAELGEGGTRADDLLLLERFLERHRESPDPELLLDLKALEAAVDADVILVVVDVKNQAPLERARDEVALLVRTSRPVVGVLNFTAEKDNLEPEWREVFRREKVHAVVAFDAMVNDPAAEAELFNTIATVVAVDRREAVERLRQTRTGLSARRRAASIRAAAELLLDALTLTVELSREETDDAEGEARRRLERAVSDRERHGLRAIGRAHGFSGEEVEAPEELEGAEILRDELFDPAALKRQAPDLLGHAAGGAALGAGVDLFVGGLSLGVGALLGGAAGLVTHFLRRAVRVQSRRDIVTARLDPEVGWLLLARIVVCHEVFRQRTHARRDRVPLETSAGTLRGNPSAANVVAILRRAAEGKTAREEGLAELETELAALLP